MNSTKMKKFNFVKYHFLALIICGIILVAGAIVWIVNGLNLSIDFTGGTIVNVKVGESLEEDGAYDSYIDQIEETMSAYGLSIATSHIEGTGVDATIQIRYQDVSGKTVEEMTQISSDFVTDLRAELGDGVTVSTGDRITATASSSLLLNALLAIFISTILIVIYVGIRFRGLNGICSVVGMILDVALVFAFTIIFNIEIDSVYIAALITIIGYSINNNIVVFDRIRENQAKYPNESYAKLVNMSLHQSLTRTVTMTVTTLLTVIVLACVGLQGVDSFIYPIIIGISLGLLTLLFVVSPMYANLADKYDSKKKSYKRKRNSETQTDEVVVEQN